MASTYTFTQKPSPVEPSAESNFGGLVVDGNHQTISGIVGAGPQTVDISASAITSPATISNSGVTTLTIPLNAAQVNFLAATNTVNICEVSASMTTYFTIPVGTQVTVDVTRCKALYLEANTGSATLSFWFAVI